MLLFIVVMVIIIKYYRLSHDVVTISRRFDCIMLTSSGDEVDWLRETLKSTMLCCDWLVFNSCDWCNSILEKSSSKRRSTSQIQEERLHSHTQFSWRSLSSTLITMLKGRRLLSLSSYGNLLKRNKTKNKVNPIECRPHQGLEVTDTIPYMNLLGRTRFS